MLTLLEMFASIIDGGNVGRVSSLIVFCIVTLVRHSGAVSQARQGCSDYATNCTVVLLKV